MSLDPLTLEPRPSPPGIRHVRKLKRRLTPAFAPGPVRSVPA